MNTRSPWLITRTLLITYLVSALLLAALSFGLYKFRLPEAQVNSGVMAIYILSCFFGGFLAGKTMKTRRFFWGLLNGLLYFAFLFLMSFLQERTVTGELPRLLLTLAICAGSGMAGGMVS